MPGGRPRVISSNKDFETMIQKYREECLEKEEIFTIIGLASYIGITKETLNQYSKKKEFSDSYKKAMVYAENDLVKNAINGKYNSTVSIFLLKNNHNYTDKTEQKVETKDSSKDIKWWLDDTNDES